MADGNERKANSWFSIRLPVDPEHPMALVVTYYSGEWRRTAAEFAGVFGVRMTRAGEGSKQAD